MKIFLLTLLATFFFITTVALLINFCKKKLRKTPHGLTGMCHNSGGAMCSGCSEKIKNKKTDTTL